MMELAAARVRVPCSTSNIVSGYDTIGLALNRFLDASFEPADGGGLTVERTGTLEFLADETEPDLVATIFARQLAREGIEPSGTLRLRSTIPIARGLGASATAVLAGFDLARAVRGKPQDEQATFEAALRFEGHGDNVAPCLFGGLRAVAVAIAPGVFDTPMMAAMSAGTDAGAWAVTISGAGSGLIAMCDPDDASAVAAAMHEVFDAGTGDPECVGFAVRPCGDGLRRVDP